MARARNARRRPRCRRLSLAGRAHRNRRAAARGARRAAARLRGVPHRRASDRRHAARDPGQGARAHVVAAAFAHHALPRASGGLRRVRRRACAAVQRGAAVLGNAAARGPLGRLARARGRTGRCRGTFFRHDAAQPGRRHRRHRWPLSPRARNAGGPGARRRAARRRELGWLAGAPRGRRHCVPAAARGCRDAHGMAGLRRPLAWRLRRGAQRPCALHSPPDRRRPVRLPPPQRMTRTAPLWVLVLLAASLAAQAAWHGALGPPRLAAEALPSAPSARALRLAAFGEAEAASRLSMLYLQTFDLHALDYARLATWLRTLLELDPRGQYPLFATARIYAEHPDPARSRLMLELIHEQFQLDPDRRWPWLAHAALLAKHRLKDLALARRYAAAIDRQVKAQVPLWARQMEIFILEDMNELEAARIMLGGLLASGKVTDPAELSFLKQRLEELEKR